MAWSNALGAVVLHAASFDLPDESIGAVRVTGEAILAVGCLAVLASALEYVL